MASTSRLHSYTERVASSAVFAVVARVLFVFPLLGIVSALRDPELDATSRAITIGGLGVSSFLLLVVGLWFVALDVTVGDEALRFRFGPFGRTLNASAVREVRVVRYPALAFGGWGWRFGRVDGRSAQAYTVPFVRSGLTVTMAEGKTYYISSRSPERLAEAIETMQRREGLA